MGEISKENFRIPVAMVSPILTVKRLTLRR